MTAPGGAKASNGADGGSGRFCPPEFSASGAIAVTVVDCLAPKIVGAKALTFVVCLAPKIVGGGCRYKKLFLIPAYLSAPRDGYFALRRFVLTA